MMSWKDVMTYAGGYTTTPYTTTNTQPYTQMTTQPVFSPSIVQSVLGGKPMSRTAKEESWIKNIALWQTAMDGSGAVLRWIGRTMSQKDSNKTVTMMKDALGKAGEDFGSLIDLVSGDTTHVDLTSSGARTVFANLLKFSPLFVAMEEINKEVDVAKRKTMIKEQEPVFRSYFGHWWEAKLGTLLNIHDVNDVGQVV
jgi:hypothetical protein